MSRLLSFSLVASVVLPALASAEPSPGPLIEPSIEPSIRFSAEVRAREELRDGVFSPADPMGDQRGDEAHLRSRLRADAVVNSQVGITVELQDVRLPGDELSTTADSEGVDLKRGYFAVRPDPLDLTIKVGRWVMAYGDQRLIGHLEWVDQGRSYDGVHVSFKPSATFVDVFAVRVRETLDAKDDLHFGGVYAGLARARGLIIEIYGLGLRDAMGDGATFATLGSRVALVRGHFDGSAEAAVQVGEVADDELVAAAAAAKAGFTFAGDQRLRLGGEVVYASGDGDPTNSADNTFRTLFPTNHFHYGYADLAAWQNLLAFRARLSATPSASTTASLDVHHLRLADSAGGWFNAAGALVRPGDALASSFLGHEIDALIGWKAIPGLALEAGVAVFVAGQFVEDTGGGDNAVFGYVQAQATY